MQINILTVFESEKREWKKIISYLKRKKIGVYTVFSAREVYETIKTEPINIILCEYHLLKIKTSAFLKKIKTIKPDVELVFLSKGATLSNAIDAMKDGAYDFYEIPVKPRLLITVIEKAIEKQSLFLEKIELEKRIKGMLDIENLVGRSKPMQYVINLISSVAPKNASVLITGETGTGKELIARGIHNRSNRNEKILVKVNCSAIPSGLIESELFGHEKGAFTGAVSKRIGRFELAEGGTMEPEVRVAHAFERFAPGRGGVVLRGRGAGGTKGAGWLSIKGSFPA